MGKLNKISERFRTNSKAAAADTKELLMSFTKMTIRTKICVFMAVIMCLLMAVGAMMCMACGSNDDIKPETAPDNVVEMDTGSAENAGQSDIASTPEAAQATSTAAETTTATTTAATTTAEQPTIEMVEQKLDINDKLQYNLNIYLSNFSEAEMWSFVDKPDNFQIIYFAMLHNHLNKYEETFEATELTIGETVYYERIHTKYIKATAKKYFGAELTEDDFRMAEEFFPYRDGYLYFEVTGGWLSSGFTVVESLTRIGEDTYEVRFSIYDDIYWYNYDGIYSLTPEDMIKAEREADTTTADRIVVRSGYGYAHIKASDLYDRSTYNLISYQVERER